jgi:diadenosine tetraphosphatase ApaH/serine/threonine PP2A family protein phosphatase
VTSPAVARDNLDLLDLPIGLHGHTHVPVAFIEDGSKVEHFGPRDGATLALAGRRALVNPGSVGQPRDGDPRSSYLVLDPSAGSITWHRVAYDIDAVQSAMRAVGLPGFLVSRLSIGL